MFISTIDSLNNWFNTHRLNPQPVNDTQQHAFSLGNEVFVIVQHKSGAIFSTMFNLLINENDCDIASLYDATNWCFEFGGNWYYCNCNDSTLPTCKDLVMIGDCLSTQSANLAYLGIHSGYELGNGTKLFDIWTKAGKFFQYKTLGICDKNTLGGVVSFQQECQKRDIKPIIGMTVSVDFVSMIGNVKLYVVDNLGWFNLLKISTLINVENQPFITTQQLREFSLGLVCVIDKFVVLTDPIVVTVTSTQFHKYFYQIDCTQYSNPNRDAIIIDNISLYLQKYSTILKPALIADTYYINDTDSHIKTKLNNAHNVNQPDSRDQYFKTVETLYDELIQVAHDDQAKQVGSLFNKAIKGTNEIAAWCHFTIDTTSLLLPEYKLTYTEQIMYNDRTQMFNDIINEQLITKTPNNDEYRQRAEYEKSVITKGGFVDYFLILYDVCRFCDHSDILRGIGRGSAGGSLVSYLLNITQIDPIPYSLLFERFLNEGRLGEKKQTNQLVIQTDELGEIHLWMDDVCTVRRDNRLIQINASELLLTDDLVSF
jgi:DNA polymerase-3 subunit alpha